MDNYNYSNMEIKFKRFHKDAVIPKQATKLSGGWDVVITRIEQKEPDLVICYLGFGLGLPEVYKLL